MDGTEAKTEAQTLNLEVFPNMKSGGHFKSVSASYQDPTSGRYISQLSLKAQTLNLEVFPNMKSGGHFKSVSASYQDPTTPSSGRYISQLSLKVGKSQKNSEENNPLEQRQKETDELLSRLHLKDKKLTPADFLKIYPPVKQCQTAVKDLPHIFLKRLMMLDHRARYIPVTEDNTEVSQSKHVPSGQCDFDAFFSASPDNDQTKQNPVHPMDVQMAVFHCSDSFLRQNMVTKLSQCQYAVPLLVPDPFTMKIECPLWTLRQIKRSWKLTDNSNRATDNSNVAKDNKDNSNVSTTKSMPICKAETAMVSFLRLGSLSVSKSELMNNLINNRHSTFFHRNSEGSTKSRYLMDGVAEIAWYCPAGKPTDAFTDCIAFCNLHGDALSCEEQRDILTEKASVNVVLLPTLPKDQKSSSILSALLNSPKPLICLIVDDESVAVELKPGKYRMGLKERSLPNVSEELKGIIRKLLSTKYLPFQLEKMADDSRIKVPVDEDDMVCQKGKTAASKILDLLKGRDISELKDAFLPCQGDRLWHEWCTKNKELYCLKGDNLEMNKTSKQKELSAIRQKQCDACPSKLMQLFIKNLHTLTSNQKIYFLKWIAILLDDLSTDDLSLLLQRYDKKWTEVLTLKQKNDKSEADKIMQKNKQTELKELSSKLQSATFGFEHILREMGQIYEAHASLNKAESRDINWSKYPELAAELMIAGHPMELMDGDAGHVPLKWIPRLLDEVIKKLGDEQVFVLSVLGIQSSGKSTMLNAMFGLQFAVSAGRCTKGAYMQLVTVSEEMRKDFKFKYILVVDTEGLRALELAGQTTVHHDNELATFVVGVGNMTLINIMGENPADMQDILQIVVQAFMRMKEVKLSPSCVFVHQNVTDIAAAEKNMEGKRRLQDNLDKMTKLAAKEETCHARCFSDIIDFDVKRDVKYFSQLWEGSPPMAPPNPGYSDGIQELKDMILKKASQSEGVSLSKFKRRIGDLCEALLNEHFVFSFKNTHEIAVYRKLEVQYGNWTWTLRSAMLTIENELHNSIENENGEIQFNIAEESRSSYEKVQTEMRTYFDDDPDKDILIQWRGRFEKKIEVVHNDAVVGLKRKLDEVVQQKIAREKIDKKTIYEKVLLEKSKVLAHGLKDKADDENELQSQFNSLWKKWVSELAKDTPAIKDINIQTEVFSVLEEIGIEWNLIRGRMDCGEYKNMTANYSDYVNLTSWTSKAKSKVGISTALPYEEQQSIESLVKQVAEQSVDREKIKGVATRGYNTGYLHEVANNVTERLNTFEKKKKDKYTLKKEFKVDLLLYACGIAGDWLVKFHKEFKTNNDAVTYLETKKDDYYNIFRSWCKGNSSAVVLGKMIHSKLKDSTFEAVCSNTRIALGRQMMSNCPAFCGNKLDLEKHVLKSLAEQKDFDQYINYIRQPKKQLKNFIKDEVNKYFTGHQDKVSRILEKNAEDTFGHVSDALDAATEKVQTDGGGTDAWLKEFSSSLKRVLIFDSKSFVVATDFSDSESFAFLKEEIEKGLASMKESTLSLDKMKEFRESIRPDQMLIDQLCNGCWAQCPFCKAVCTHTLLDHDGDHSVPFHRPSAVKGMYTRGTNELYIDFCTTSVASDGSFHPDETSRSIAYKLYRTAGPKFENWSITADNSQLTYWKWFVCHFQKQLENRYEKKFEGRGQIPDTWTKYTDKDAIKSL